MYFVSIEDIIVKFGIYADLGAPFQTLSTILANTCSVYVFLDRGTTRFEIARHLLV